MHGLKQFCPRQCVEHRNPLASPLLMRALDPLSPSVTDLLRLGRVADAAAIADMILIEGDHI